MSRAVSIAFFALLLALAGLWVALRIRTPAKSVSASASADAAPSPSAVIAPPDAGAARTPPPLPPAADAAVAAAAVAPAAEERTRAVRRRLDDVLAGDAAKVAKVDSVTCDATTCQVVLEVTDLDAFGPILARLEEPGTGFAGDAARMRLENPVPLGPEGTGPWRFSFTLLW